MSLRHLTDNEIQEYLDGKFAKNGRFISDHLAACDYCQAQLSEYQTLFGALRKEVTFRLPISFTDRVIASVANVPTTSRRFGVMAALSTLMLLVLAATTAFYFIGLTPIKSGWNFVTRVAGSVNLEWLGPINVFLAGLDLNLSLFGAAVFVVVFMSLIDYLLLRPRHKVVSLIKTMVV